MGWKKDFDLAVKKYFDIPEDAEIHIQDEATYYTGCPTCGGTYEFEVEVYYYGDKNSKYPNGYVSKTFQGKMTEFINSLED